MSCILLLSVCCIPWLVGWLLDECLLFYECFVSLIPHTYFLLVGIFLITTYILFMLLFIFIFTLF